MKFTKMQADEPGRIIKASTDNLQLINRTDKLVHE